MILADRAATWTDATQLTSDNAFIEFVDASPDGSLLALSSDRRGNQDLWLMPAAGGNMTPLTTDPTPDWNPRWSPDGRDIAFYAYRTGNRDIFVMPSGGGAARQLTSDPAQDRIPSWSPDGHEVAFQSARLNPIRKTWSVDRGQVSRLIKLQGRRGALGYVFTTDGRYLYFTWREDDGDIWVMDVATKINN